MYMVDQLLVVNRSCPFSTRTVSCLCLATCTSAGRENARGERDGDREDCGEERRYEG